MFGQVPDPSGSWRTGHHSCSDRAASTAPSSGFGKIDRQLRALLNVQVAALYRAPVLNGYRHASA